MAERIKMVSNMKLNIAFIKRLKIASLFAAVLLLIIVTSSCTKSYDVFIINYNENAVYVLDDLTKRENAKKINPKEFIVLKRGFMTGIGDLTYFIVDEKGDLLYQYRFECETLEDKYFVYNDKFIIIEIR